MHTQLIEELLQAVEARRISRMHTTSPDSNIIQRPMEVGYDPPHHLSQTTESTLPKTKSPKSDLPPTQQPLRALENLVPPPSDSSYPLALRRQDTNIYPTTSKGIQKLE